MSDFYHKLSVRQKNERVFGQIVRAPFPFIRPSLLALRLGSLKSGNDIRAAELVVTRLGLGEVGNHSERDKVEMKKKMPIPELGLELAEELVVTKTKMRPAVLIHHQCLDWRKEANYVAHLTGKMPEPNRHLLAPIFSLRKMGEQSDFPEAFIEKVKSGAYPHIMFLPAFEYPVELDSMVVLSDLFQAGLHTFDTSHLCVDPEELALKMSDWVDFMLGSAQELAEEIRHS